MKALAFDLDDTLYSERDYCRACIANVAERAGAMFGADPALLEADMLSGHNPYGGLCAGGRLGGRLDIDTFLDIYRATTPASLPLREDARRMLDTLRERRPDVPLYIITDGRLRGQQAKIDALGLTEWFDPAHIIISEAIGFDKTTPMPFITAMMREQRHSGWVYVGDNVAKDFRWPRRLGWTAIMLADRGGNTHRQPPMDETAPEWRSDIVIDSFDYIIQNLCQQLS